MKGKIVKISGPLIVAAGMADCRMYDVVRVSGEKLIGEIIELKGDLASIQVYEETDGLRVGEEVVSTENPLSVELGPGLVASIFDGIQRPLERLRDASGERIGRGVELTSLDHERKWDFLPAAKPGDVLEGGDLLGTVRENEVFEHRILLPPDMRGKVLRIQAGSFTVDEPVALLETPEGERKVSMLRRWPVRIPRPYREKLSPDMPMTTGQRVIDTLFPIARGGVAAVPGPFGSGKTVVQHQLAKWADADVIVYVGCGERGNEMTDVLNEFPGLKDPRTGEALMKRTVLIANTSDMPVAAREASIYTGITIAEYFRDMGYHVAIMADSTSRWAEALREMSGRLEEMPGEEGYPAYLSSRLAQFYERAGIVRVLGSEERTGSVTAIGAVSPPGGDLSEPVSQATLRIVKVFWGLSAQLAYRRHFPAVDWLTSYSLYADRLADWYAERVAEGFPEARAACMRMLQEESELNEIVRLVGMDALSEEDALKLETAKSIREDFLHQNAFHETDTYTPLERQYRLLKCILDFHEQAKAALARGVGLSAVLSLPVRRKIAKLKYAASAAAFEDAERETKRVLSALGRGER